jgi:hypothetical protein
MALDEWLSGKPYRRVESQMWPPVEGDVAFVSCLQHKNGELVVHVRGPIKAAAGIRPDDEMVRECLGDDACTTCAPAFALGRLETDGQFRPVWSTTSRQGRYHPWVRLCPSCSKDRAISFLETARPELHRLGFPLGSKEFHKLAQECAGRFEAASRIK